MCQVTNKASLYSEKFQKDKLLVPGTPGTLVVYMIPYEVSQAVMKFKSQNILYTSGKDVIANRFIIKTTTP
jgi:hypothetical protein